MSALANLIDDSPTVTPNAHFDEGNGSDAMLEADGVGSGALGAIHDDVMGSTGSTTWLIAAFYVPVMHVSRPSRLAIPGKAQRGAIRSDHPTFSR